MTRIKLRHVHAFVDRHGRVRHYFRQRDSKQTPLPGLPGSAEFMAAYQAALAGVTTMPREIGASRTKPGTVDACIRLLPEPCLPRTGQQHPAHEEGDL
jgi:hypothetical protein